MSKQKKEEGVTLSAEQEALLSSLKEANDQQPVHIITGKDDAGKELMMFLKSPSYQLRKALFNTLKADITKELEAGEMILLDCYIGGDNLYESENTRLEAAIAAVNLFDFNSTFELFKKKIVESEYKDSGKNTVLELKHMDALIRFHLKLNPDELVTTNADGTINFDKYVEVWSGLEWVLRNKEF